MSDTNRFNGLTERHVKQIIRRKMITRVVKNKKTYSRKTRSGKGKGTDGE